MVHVRLSEAAPHLVKRNSLLPLPSSPLTQGLLLLAGFTLPAAALAGLAHRAARQRRHARLPEPETAPYGADAYASPCGTPRAGMLRAPTAPPAPPVVRQLRPPPLPARLDDSACSPFGSAALHACSPGGALADGGETHACLGGTALGASNASDCLGQMPSSSTLDDLCSVLAGRDAGCGLRPCPPLPAQRRPAQRWQAC